jgi:hypothetical protein
MEMFKKQKNPVIKFVSTVPGLEGLEDVRPVPASQFYPKWWKGVPFQDKKTNDYTVKACPAMPDYFSQGYVMPMWADTTLEYDPETTGYRWKMGRGGAPYSWDIHTNSQMIDHVGNTSHQGSDANFIFKASCPWRIVAPKGYSILQLPLFYHFNNEFSVLPGIIRSDIHHEINQQVLLHQSEKKSIFIKRGSPFVQYIPIKRENFDLDVHFMTEEENHIFLTNDLDINSSNMGSQKYRKNWNK